MKYKHLEDRRGERCAQDLLVVSKLGKNCLVAKIDSEVAFAALDKR